MVYEAGDETDGPGLGSAHGFAGSVNVSHQKL